MSDWRAFPRRGAPRVWIGPEDSVAQGLKLHAPYSLAGRAAHWLLTRLPDALARPLLPRPADLGETDRLDALRDQIRAWLDEPGARVSIAPGTPGPHNKQTAQVGLRGQIIAYAKVARTPAAAALLAREKAALERLAAEAAPPWAHPRLLGWRAEDGLTALIQTAAPPGSRPLAPGLDPSILQTLGHLPGFGTAEAALATVLGEAAEDLAPVTGSRAEARRYLAAHFGARPVRTAFAHGDFAPWNLRRLPGGGLYLFDWEYAADHPLLTDLLHYLFMPAVLVAGRSPREAVAHLFSALQAPAITPLLATLGLDRTEVPAYVLLYFLGLERRQVRLDGGRPDYLGDCLHHGLVRAGHPGTRPRVLVAAYACEPDQGSEPGVGWQMAQAISEYHEAWVVTRDNNRTVIEQALTATPNPHLHFVYLDLPAWARSWKKGGRGVRTYYYLWQLLAAWRCRRLLGEVSFDLAHHVTFVNDWLYTFLALLPLPFVWGPIGSHPPIPVSLAADESSLRADRLRCLFQQAMRVLDPLFWRAFARAALVIGIDQSVFERLPLRWVEPERRLVHTAIGVETLPAAGAAVPAGDFTVLSVGRLVPIKGFHLTVAAFARFAARQPRARLLIIGKGPLEAGLLAQARDLGVADRVEIREWAPRATVLQAMATAQVFLFPSFEGGGMVVLEALGSGLPLVGLAYGGPGAMAGPGTGVMVPVGEREATIAALAEALGQLADDETRRAAGAAARRHVAERYLWSGRGQVVAQWYQAAMRQS